MIAGLRSLLEARLPNSRIARRILTLAGGTAMAQVITVCAMPIVTRLYSPAQFGIASLFLSFFGFWAATLSLRYEYAILITTDDPESHVVHRLALLLVLGMSVLALPVLFCLRDAGLLGFGLLPRWVPFAAVPILAGYGVFMVYRAWALRAGLVKEITRVSIARAGASSVTQILLGFFSAGVPGLFAAQFASSWTAMLRLVSVMGNHYLPSKPRRIGVGDLRAVARRYAKFPLFEAPSAWIDQLGMLLPVPMIAGLHGATAAGWLGLAGMIVGIPNAQIGNAVADVFQMEIAAAAVANDTVRARSLFYRLARKLALIGLVPFALVSASAVWLVPWIFGASWRDAGVAAALIAPWLYAALIVSPLSRLLSVLQAQELKLVYDIAAVLFLAVAFLVSKVGHYSFAATVSAISIAQIAGYLVYAGVLVFAIESRLAPTRKPAD